MNYVEIARQRWRHATIHGTGQFAVVRKTNDVYLFPTFEQARNVRLGWSDCQLVDLEPTPFPENCKDRLGYE